MRLSAKKRRRRLNPRLAKIHRNYTVDEVARLYDVHRNTVRLWIKQGLPTTDNRRPMLILGHDLRAFLEARRSKNRRACKPGEMYCLRCREPRAPAGAVADFERITETLGNLVAICSHCGAVMNRRVNIAKLADVSGEVAVTMTLAARHLSESNQPTLNSDFALAD